MNHHRQLQDVLSTTATPTTVPVVDGATTSAPSSSVVVETTRPPRRTRRPRPSRPATTAPVTGSGTVVPGTTTSPPVIATVTPGTTTATTSPVSIGTGAPGTSPPVVTTTLPPAGQSTTTTTAPTIAGTISTQEGDDDGLENSGTDEVGTGNNNEVDKGEITEVIEDVLEQWEDVTDDRFVTNPNTNEIMNDDENENDNDDEKNEDDETNVEIDDDDEKDEINQDSSDEQDGSLSSNNKVDGDVFDGYEYKKGSNCQQSTDNDEVPCAPTNLQSLCNKYDRNNGSFRDCLNACKPAFCK
jgi:hypothetical protein